MLSGPVPNSQWLVIQWLTLMLFIQLQHQFQLVMLPVYRHQEGIIHMEGEFKTKTWRKI